MTWYCHFDRGIMKFGKAIKMDLSPENFGLQFVAITARFDGSCKCYWSTDKLCFRMLKMKRNWFG